MTRTGSPWYTTRMKGTLTERLILAHLAEGEPATGREIALHQRGGLIVAGEQIVGRDPGEPSIPALDVGRREQVLPQIARQRPARDRRW